MSFADDVVEPSDEPTPRQRLGAKLKAAEELARLRAEIRRLKDENARLRDELTTRKRPRSYAAEVARLRALRRRQLEKLPYRWRDWPLLAEDVQYLRSLKRLSRN